MAGESHKVERTMKMKSSAEEFFGVFGSKAHKISDITPDVVPKVEVHEGAWETPLGSIKRWEYMLDGKQEFLVEKVVAFDEAKRTMIVELIDGHMMQEQYDSVFTTLTVTPSDENDVTGCLVEWTMECVKKHGEAPDANIYMNVIAQMAKDIDDHLTPAIV